MVPGLWGSIIGMLGTLISRGSDIYEKKQEDKAQLALADSQVNLMKLELEKFKLQTQGDIETIKANIEASLAQANITADTHSMIASMKLAQATDKADTSKLGTIIRAGLRPILTLLYTAGFLYVVFVATTDKIIEAQADAIFFAFIDTAVAITLWWFGIRKSDRAKENTRG